MSTNGDKRRLRLNWTFLFLLVLLPFGGWNLPVIPVKMNYILTLIAGGIAILSLDREVNLSVYAILTILLQALLVLWIIISNLATPSFSYVGVIPKVGYFIWTCSIIIINKNRKDWYRCIGGLLLGATLAGILTVIISIFNWKTGIAALPPMSISQSRLPFLRRVVGAPLSFGSFGMLTIGTFAYSCARWRVHSVDRLRYLFFAFTSLLLFSSLIISQSRSTWVGTVVAAVTSLTILYIIRNVESDYRMSTTTRYVGAIVGSSFILSSPIIVTWLINIGKVTLYTRVEQYIAAIEGMRLKPLFGAGQAYRFSVPDTQIHNAYLKLGAENGIPALLIVTILTILLLVALWRTIQITNGTNRLCAIAVYAGVIGVIIESQFVAGFSRIGWIWFAFAASLHSVSVRSHSSKSDRFFP